MDQALMMQLEAVHNESQEVEEKLNVVEQQISELDKFSETIKNLDDVKGKDILASLGKGVYVKSEVKEDKFFVEVGAGVFVRKSASDTHKIIQDQVKRLGEMKVHLFSENERVNSRLNELISQIQESETK